MKIKNLPDLIKDYKTVEEWEKDRGRLLQTVMSTEYGIRPDIPFECVYKCIEEEQVLDGNAVRKTLEVCVKTQKGEWKYPVYLWTPKKGRLVPLNLFLSVRKRKSAPPSLPEGETVESVLKKLPDMIRHPERSMPNEMPEVTEPFYMDRDIDTEYWPVRMCLKQGIAMAGVYLDDIELDNPNEFPSGLAGVFSGKERGEEEWGAVAVWAFGASLALNAVLDNGTYDPERLSVTGHSRAGKAAIVAGINDERFTCTIANESGCCGSAIAREKEGESVMSIQYSFPHWFPHGFKKYGKNEDMLPFDQHSVLALIAPRKLYVTSGYNDCWSGPAWEYEGIRQASKVWELYGEKSQFPEDMPEANEPVQQKSLAYHVREGGHALRKFDWDQFMKYM